MGTKNTQDKALPRALFACIRNAGRSQIAAALYRSYGGFAASAGTSPASSVHENVARCMQELGHDLSSCAPTKLTAELIKENKIDVLVTMGCGEQCPYVPGVQIVAWNIPDPNHMDDSGTMNVISVIQQEIQATFF